MAKIYKNECRITDEVKAWARQATERGQLAFEAYMAEITKETYDENTHPRYLDLKPEIRDAWMRVYAEVERQCFEYFRLTFVKLPSDDDGVEQDFALMQVLAGGDSGEKA